MIRTHGQGRVYHGEDAARTAGDLWRDGDLFVVKTTGASYVRTAGAWVQISVGSGTTDHNSLSNFDGGTTGEYYHLTAAQHSDLTDGGNTTLHAHDAYIANSLLTARGDIITRNATIPERLALTVPSAPTINFLGVLNGELQPTWKSASSAPGAAAAVLQTKATGELRLGAVLQIVGDTFPTTGAGLELGGNGVYSVIESVNRDTSTGMPIHFNYGITGDMVFNAGASNGNVQIGGTANRGTTVSAKALNIFDGTAPVGTLANGITLYSSGGIPYVMDAAGAARNLMGSSNPGAAAALLATDASGGISIDSGVLYVDPANNRVGINHTTPVRTFVVSAGAPAIGFNDTGVTYSADQLTAFVAQQNEIGLFGAGTSTNGTVYLKGVSIGAAGAAIGVYLDAYLENDPSTYGAIYANAYKRSGTGVTALADTASLLRIANNLGGKFTVFGNGNIDAAGSILRLRTSKTPSSASDTGNVGEICWDAGFIYICTASNAWERAAIATW